MYAGIVFHCTLRFSGSCRPNPGHGSIGFVIYRDHDGAVLEQFSTYINDCFRLPSNAAHYKALIAGLQHALWRGITHITALGHSQLLCKQVTGEWNVKDLRLKRYCDRVRELASLFDSFELKHIYAEHNSAARSLAREGFYTTSVDFGDRAEREILHRCSDPESAQEFVMEQRCDGYEKMKYMLDTIQFQLPESYAAVRQLCSDISEEMGGWCQLRNNRVRASLLAIS